MSEPLIEVTVMTRQEQLFHGKALSVSSVNDTGPFDILGYHSNFICLIRDRLSIKDEKGEMHEFHIAQGLLRVIEDKVKIFLGLLE